MICRMFSYLPSDIYKITILVHGQYIEHIVPGHQTHKELLWDDFRGIYYFSLYKGHIMVVKPQQVNKPHDCVVMIYGLAMVSHRKMSYPCHFRRITN